MPTPIVGYFYDALNGIHERCESGPAVTADVELSPISHDFKPTQTTDVVIAGPDGAELVRPGIGMKLHHTGGGLQNITVPYWARRFTRGDAEKYLYDMLVHLGRSDLGELSIHDKAYTNCWFVGGDGEVIFARSNDATDGDPSGGRPRFHVRGSLRFVRGLPPAVDLAMPSSLPPPERMESIGGVDNGDYTATIILGPYDGQIVKIGRFCDLKNVSVDRPVLVTAIPRCDGARIAGRGHTQPGIRTQLDYRRGRTITLNLRGFVFASQDNSGLPEIVPGGSDGITNRSRAVLERRILALQIALRGERVKLTGNGNTFHDCYLRSLRPDDDTEAFPTLGFNATFEQEYNEVSF